MCVCVCVQYENQVNILGTWTNKGPTMSRPKFSDSEGKVSPLVNFFCVALFQGILFPLCARVWKGLGWGVLNALVGGFCVYTCFVCVCVKGGQRG